MDMPRGNDHLGVNKTGKNIRKSPLHLPSFAANANLAAAEKPQAQPQVYNIRRNQFKSLVQELTGSPSGESTLPHPPQNNSSNPQNTRLQRIRPPPLTQINRPAVPLQHHPHCFMRPPPNQGTQQQPMMMGQGDQFWSKTAECPFSEYMRYLQSPLGYAGPSGNQMQPGHEQCLYIPCHEHRPYMPVQPQPQPQPYMPTQPQSQPQPYMPTQPQSQPQPYMPTQPQYQPQPYMPAQPQAQPQPYMPAQPQAQPQPYMPAQPQPQSQPQPYMPYQPESQPEPYMMHGSQPQMNMHGPLQHSQYLPPPGLVPDLAPHNLPPPQFNGHVPVTSTLPSPIFNQIYDGLPSPRYENFGQLDSLTSQFALPSMFSPRSPGVEYPQPPTPNFSFSQLAQSGSLGPGSGPPEPPPSPGLLPVPSPRWGDY